MKPNIPGYGNKRLYSFRRARMRQAGEHTSGLSDPYFPTQQQDIVSAERFVGDLTGPQSAERAKQAAKQQKAADANLLAGQKLASSQGIVKCQNTIWHTAIKIGGNATPISIVPQNFNRVSLIFSIVTATAGDTASVYFSFGAPLALTTRPGVFGGFLLRFDLTPGDQVVKDTFIFNSTVIPTDEIFIANSTTSNGFDVLVYEGTPI